MEKNAPPAYSEIDPLHGHGVGLNTATGTAHNVPDYQRSTDGIPSKYPNTEPPPYSKVHVKQKMREWEEASSANFFQLDRTYGEDERCSSCFDPVREKCEGSQRAVKEGIRIFHYECFVKNRGPKCSYCCFALSKPDKDHELSGQFLFYQGKNYHVECYEKYAGPRCTYCCNVIIERPNGEYTGYWMMDGPKMFHEECFYQKQNAGQRAKAS